MSLGHLSQIVLSLCELALKEQSGEQWTGLGCTAFCSCLGAVGRVAEHLFLQIYFPPLELGQLPLETRGFFFSGAGCVHPVRSHCLCSHGCHQQAGSEAAQQPQGVR